jgi:hypothetical protein
MAGTVVITYLVAEQPDGRYLVCPPTTLTYGPLKKPTEFSAGYTVIGPAKLVYRTLPPTGPTTGPAIRDWMQRVQELGCWVYPSDFTPDYNELTT